MVRSESIGSDELYLLRDALVLALLGLGMGPDQAGKVVRITRRHVNLIRQKAPEGLREDAAGVVQRTLREARWVRANPSGVGAHVRPPARL